MSRPTQVFIFRSYILKLGAVNVDSKDEKYVEERGIDSMITHPRYNARTLRNDIALLKMDKKVMFSPFVRPMCLDYKGEFQEHTALAIGHGYTTNAGLSKFEVIYD